MALQQHSCNTLYKILKNLDCWTNLSSTVVNEGVQVGFDEFPNDTPQTDGYEQCEKKCDEKPGVDRCRSFTYCPKRLDCFLYGKVVYGNETLNMSRIDDCYSNYRSPCKHGILIFVSILLEEAI